MRELNANCLKIDKYFIDSLFEVGRDAAITATSSLSHTDSGTCRR